ncbi:MAG TPA: hypothetical protein VLX92_11020 [Kofleriaceae bacterium]|nr:hypothetical protein [Kofleriaceae bacterium]
MTPRTSRTRAHAIGELAIGGDWACAHGDFGTLAYLARRLSTYVAEPLHCQLAALAELCRSDPGRAVEQWSHVRDLLYQ